MYKTKAQYQDEFRRLFVRYPIAQTIPMGTLQEEYAKLRVVAYIVALDIKADLSLVVQAFCDLRSITTTNIPTSLIHASQTLGLRNGFVQDWGKVEMLRQGNPCMTELAQLVYSYICENHTLLCFKRLPEDKVRLDKN